ncbi:MAG: hypothetical protein SF066_23230 [Thermoanaerobaculia bacterium]|nr:hypothetical protein [Thermoanaerobaculia bacterium]
MNRTNSLRSSFALAVFGILFGLGAFAAGADTPSASTLGSQGEIYAIKAGTYGALFPKGTALQADRAVLALDITRPDRSRQRVLVRGTERPEVDASPNLFFERGAGTLYVVWESRRSANSSALLLSSFKGGKWGDPIEISDDLAPLKGAPQIAITRDGFTTRGSEDELLRHDTTVLHLVWWEKQAQKPEEVFYAPVVLENGAYVGWNPIYSLNDLDLSEEGASVVPEALLRAPTLAPGKDVHSVVIGLVNARTGRILGIEVRPVPGEIGFVVDAFRTQLIDIGRRDDDRIKAAIEGFRTQLIDIGARFNPGVVRALGTEVSEVLKSTLAAAPANQPYGDLVDDFRQTVIRLGAEMLGDLTRSDRPALTLEIDRREADVEGDPERTHLIGLRLVSDRPAPPVGAGKARIYVSEDASSVLVSWRDGENLVYSEEVATEDGLGAAWAPAQRLPLEGLTEPEAERMLESRVRQRH